MLELMARAGLRASEVCGLHLRDWRPRDHTLHIRAEVGKGEREAYLPLDEGTEELLERWKGVRRQYAAGEPWLFTTLKGGQLDRRYVWQMTSRYARRARLERPVWPHALRHTHATELLREGFDVREVQTLMRHEDLRTTAVYLSVHNAQLAEKVRRRRR